MADTVLQFAINIDESERRVARYIKGLRIVQKWMAESDLSEEDLICVRSTIGSGYSPASVCPPSNRVPTHEALGRGL